MPEGKYDPEVLMHKGRQTKIIYIGGDYNGELKQMRAPINPVVEVAKPPKYKGNNFYDGAISALGYQTYHLREHNGVKYYVWSEWLKMWDDGEQEYLLTCDYETDNQRAMRLEEEQREREREEAERQKKLAKEDFEKLGIAIEGPDGKRIDPRTLRIFVNANHEGARKRFLVQEKI